MAVTIDRDHPSTLARVVRYHRKHAGLSRVALAELAGVGKTVIYDIEHGKQTVRLATLLRVLDVLNITLGLSGPLMKAYEESERAR